MKIYIGEYSNISKLGQCKQKTLTYIKCTFILRTYMNLLAPTIKHNRIVNGKEGSYRLSYCCEYLLWNEPFVIINYLVKWCACFRWQKAIKKHPQKDCASPVQTINWLTHVSGRRLHTALPNVSDGWAQFKLIIDFYRANTYTHCYGSLKEYRFVYFASPRDVEYKGAYTLLFLLPNCQDVICNRDFALPTHETRAA